MSLSLSAALFNPTASISPRRVEGTVSFELGPSLVPPGLEPKPDVQPMSVHIASTHTRAFKKVNFDDAFAVGDQDLPSRLSADESDTTICPSSSSDEDESSGWMAKTQPLTSWRPFAKELEPMAVDPAKSQPLSTMQALPSIGSIMHGSGECKPCAWFWKPQGCSNGVDCFHCHRCPPDELKSRKKGKVSALRGRGVAKQGAPVTKPLLSLEATVQPSEAAQSGPPGLSQHTEPPLEQTAVAQSGPPGLSQYTEPPLEQPAVAAAPPGLPIQPELTLSSAGALLHGTGKCKPCAWFWKPQGCLNGVHCMHCHSCGPDELKTRRRTKPSAK